MGHQQPTDQDMDLSVDLETLSTQNNAIILSIGAIFFNPTTGELGDSTEINLTPTTAPPALHICPNTVMWWMTQSDEARAKLNQNTLPYSRGIKEFALWLSNQPLHLQRIWANSPSFDIQILKTSFDTCGIPWPFKYWAERDIRTIKDLGWPNGDRPNFNTGTKHGALDDATAQAKLVIEAYRNLGLAPAPAPAPAPKPTPRQKAHGKTHSTY